jgi:DNA-binding transcriptional LysR family regulator
VERDIRDLDLNLLPVLNVLLEERSVTRAARRLHLTQSTVSGMLARMREALDDPLFVRDQHGIVPTPRAELMIQPLKSWLAATRTLVEPIDFDPKSWSGTVSVAATDYTHHVLLESLLERVRDQAPNLRVAVFSLAFSTISEKIARGQLDLAISLTGYLPKELMSMSLMRERYVLAMGSKHPLAAKKRITLRDFCSYEHIVVSPSGGSFAGPVDEELARRGRERKVRVSVPSFALVPGLLRRGDLLCTAPERFLAQHKGIHIGKGPFEHDPVEVIAVWPRRLDEDAAHQWFRSVLAETARSV